MCFDDGEVYDQINIVNPSCNINMFDVAGVGELYLNPFVILKVDHLRTRRLCGLLYPRLSEVSLRREGQEGRHVPHYDLRGPLVIEKLYDSPHYLGVCRPRCRFTGYDIGFDEDGLSIDACPLQPSDEGDGLSHHFINSSTARKPDKGLPVFPIRVVKGARFYRAFRFEE